MTRDPVRLYEVLRRIARVKALQASMALVDAARAEQAASDDADRASSLCVAALSARERCVRRDGDLSLAAYWVFTELHDSLQARHQAAVDVLQSAQEQRQKMGAVAASTQRLSDGVEEELAHRRHEMVAGMDDQLRADSLDIWMQGRGDA